MKQQISILDRTAAVIPAFNAASLIERVIQDTSQLLPAERIIVVDDGSSDNTYDIASAAGTTVVKHPKNLGKGSALCSGLNKAYELGADYAFTIDADYQHDPKEIPHFIDHLENTDADIIIGNRMSDIKDMPRIRILTNRFTSWVVSLKAGQKIPDSQSGYRLIKTSLFKKLRIVTSRYETESEILIKAAKLGARIDAVPIKTIYAEEVSSINPFIDTIRFFRLVIKSLFW
ncbi:MAG: glycosyltransferase [Candidatus Latescibacteria bacterium]|nr:glycosyltransferase [Candidatus Latescibacterota bacterium]NIM21315.1 glycosyltransferase [Candidatus Latescibacterota bacterium]NIM65496.1 glycosyltransferase [Candidatus Latescibacterota bacterium]NIO01876.1 glycosyltransferase [Candidatus Latescibacterota bacterium]NIO28689.1 glycosyltransferase [Candidatus Latescibacterota bacterium]